MHPIRRISLLLSLLPHLAAIALGQEPASPNIILILTDDLGWSCLSSHMDIANGLSASDYHETPNMDRLAASGMRFSRAYAPASICSPSRRSILFGHTSVRQGNLSFAENYHPAQGKHATLPQVLRRLNPHYRTGHFGKWDMRAGFSPEDAGYDESDGNTGNKHGNFLTDGTDKWEDHVITPDPKRMNTLTERATNFMTRQTHAGKPFFLQVSHYATHVEKQATAETYNRYAEKPKGQKHDDPAWAAMLEDLDHTIGILLDTLQRLGIAENTYFFLTSDNGATEFIPPTPRRLEHPADFPDPMRNAPLRGGKWTLYEGGIRVPFLVMGPGIEAESQCDMPIAGWDLLPTFAELANGAPLPTPLDTDGGSLVNLLKGETPDTVNRHPQALFFHRYHQGYPHSAVIDGDYKLVKFWKTGKVELYDLKSDIGERKDISTENPRKTEALLYALTSYFRQVNPDLLNP